MFYNKPFDKKICNTRFEALKQEASSYVTTWKDIQALVVPSRGFFENIPNQGQSFDHKLLVDSTQVKDNITMASGLMSGLTSPSRPWFKLALDDLGLMEDVEVALWLDDVIRRINYVFQESNIYGTLYNIYEELGSFGTAAMALVEDEVKVIRGRNYTCGEYYIGHDHKGDINTFGREFWMTVDQIVGEFGLENCSKSVQELYKSKTFDQWIQVRHLIEVNRYRTEGKVSNLNMPFVSYHWEAAESNDNNYLGISGFEEFPIMAPRWSVPTQMSTYGKGPAWEALGDIKMLQKMQKDKLMGLDKVVNPPVQVDASVQGEPNLLPGGVTRFSATLPNAGVRSAYQVPLDLAAVEATIQKTRDDVGQSFFRDVFLTITRSVRPQMTAREVTERHEEKLLSIGPVLNKLEKELLTPLIDRTFNIMYRRGLLLEEPEVIQGLDLKIEYISMLFQAQKMIGIIPNDQTMGAAINVSQAYPSALDVLNAEEYVREYATLSGASPRIIRSKEEVKMIQEARSSQQQEMQQQQQIGQAIQGAKALSDTSLEKNNALRAMIT